MEQNHKRARGFGRADCAVEIPIREESYGQFSPDGRWLAFMSTESGREEVYVTPIPGPGGKWQVSADEGDRPRWNQDGTRLTYLDNKEHIVTAEVAARGSAFEVGEVKILFSIDGSRPGKVYDLFPDGERMVVNQRFGVADEARLVLVQGWADEVD